MRCLLEWWTRGYGGPYRDAHRRGRLRRGMTRVRLRSEYHRARAAEAQSAFDRASRRVRFLELSDEARVPELVEAHQELLRARNALDHHERRRCSAEELYGTMEGDRRRLEEGREAEHWEVYATELDG